MCNKTKIKLNLFQDMAGNACLEPAVISIIHPRIRYIDHDFMGCHEFNF